MSHPRAYDHGVASEAQASMTDHALDLAARVMALGEARQDGWCRAEDVIHSGDRSLEESDHSVSRWARRLDDLLRERPEVRVVTDGTDAYPPNLRPFSGRPALLFVDGLITDGDDRALAVVGSRRADDAAVAETWQLAGELARRGYTVVSGLARGVDTAAHKGALDAGGRTIAVVGTGIDEVFPPENGGLVDRIRRSGALVSQFPPGHGPTKTTFPARNAVIAGLSLGSVVVTASERSGTRIEIDRTLAQGRPVFLWEPFLAHEAWARRLAATSLVHLVSSVEQIDSIVGGEPRA